MRFRPVTKRLRPETLAVAFPPRFPQSDFVLKSLRQWEFRPTTRDGNVTAMEMLLIILDEEPDE
jgi:hypothetical protein